MRPFHSSPNHPLNPFKSFFKYRKGISWLLLFAFFNTLVSCYYFRVKTQPLNLESISRINQERKYIILHNDKEIYHLKDIYINETTKEISGNLEAVDSRHYEFKARYPNNEAPRYKPNKSNPTIEAHIRASNLNLSEFPKVTVPLGSINRIDVYDEAMGKSIFSFVGFTLGVIVSLIVVLVAIVALTKSSCPFVYVFDGENFNFAGELYPGAIYSAIERDDYLPLPQLKAINGKYRIQISNELKEKQYTDLAEILVAEHPANTKVILDKYGEPCLLEAPESPYQALSSNNMDCRQSLLEADSNYYLFNEEQETCSIYLSFKKKKENKSGKLILKAKNSYWLDYIYGKFNEQFGSRFNEFQKRTNQLPARRIKDWTLEQDIPLKVYLKTENNWKLVDYFELVGPLSSRELVMQVDLSSIQGDSIQLKLECGYMFWEVDYAAMDFNENQSVSLSKHSPIVAIDEKENDVKHLLSKQDKKYLVQPEIGNRVLLEYSPAPARPGFQTSIFLHSRGYYEYIRDYKGEPDLKRLKSFKKKGALPAFSKQLYTELLNSNSLFVNASPGNN